MNKATTVLHAVQHAAVSVPSVQSHDSLSYAVYAEINNIQSLVEICTVVVSVAEYDYEYIPCWAGEALSSMSNCFV